jgi:hypothetical protein
MSSGLVTTSSDLPPPEHRAVEAVVRSLLSVGGKRIDRAQFTCGPLAQYLKLADESEDPAEELSSTLEVTRLSVVSLGPEQAEVSLEARTKVEMTHPAMGPYSVELDYSGPVHLRRIDGQWKVADYVVDGRSSLDGIVFPQEASTGTNGVGLTLLALDRQRRGTLVLVELTNTRAQPVDLVYGALRFWRNLLPRWEWNRVPGMNQVPAMGRLRTHVGWPGLCLPLSARRLRVRIGAREIAAGETFDLNVMVRLPPHRTEDLAEGARRRSS